METVAAGVRPAQLLALAGGLIALLALIGYAYSATSLIGVRQFIPMALNTAIAFAILSVGILHARPDRGADGRRHQPAAPAAPWRGGCCPAAILIPAAVGWVSWLAQQAGGAEPGHGDVAVRRGQHRALHGADLVERGVARPHGPRAAAGGAAPGRPVHGVARPGGVAPARRRRARDPAGDLREPGLDGGRHVAGRPGGRRAALRRRVALPVVPGGGIRGPDAGGPRSPPASGLPGRVWASGQPAWIPDVVPDANFPRARAAAREGLHGAFGFPIVVGSDILGVVEAFSGEIQQPDDELLQMLAAVGSQIGQFIKRKQAEEEVLQERYLLSSLMDTVPDSIYFKDAEGRFLRINKALADRFRPERPRRGRGQDGLRLLRPRSTPARPGRTSRPS